MSRGAHLDEVISSLEAAIAALHKLRIDVYREAATADSDPRESGLLTVKQAAQFLSMSTRQLSRIVADGEIRAVRRGNKYIRYSVTALRKWIAENEQ